MNVKFAQNFFCEFFVMMRVFLILAALMSIRSVLKGDVAIGMNPMFLLGLVVTVFCVWDTSNYLRLNEDKILKKITSIKNKVFKNQDNK